MAGIALLIPSVRCGDARTEEARHASAAAVVAPSASEQAGQAAPVGSTDASSSLAQPGPQPRGPVDEDGYVGTVLKRELGETPRMGWFLPGAGFVTPERQDAVSLLTDRGSPSRVAYKGIVTPSQRSVMKEQFLACETFAKDPLFLFGDASSHGDFARALFVTRPLPATVRGGLQTTALTADDLSLIDRTLGWERLTGPRWDGAGSLAGSPFFYSIHRRYDGASKELRREALVLHDAARRVIAFDKTDDVEQELCDGCGLPQASDNVGFLFRPLNLFQLPGFRYPVMLLDTSTIEGRALSLMTFTPDGVLSSFRQYEYAFTCGLYDGGVQ
jgi:hypothetical protein